MKTPEDNAPMPARDHAMTRPTHAAVDGYSNGATRNGVHAANLASRFSFDAWSLLRAIGRRWMLTVALATLFSGIATAATWYMIPTPYTSYALLRISSKTPSILYKQDEAQFQTYRANLVGLIRSPIVANAALNRPEVASLPQVQAEPDQVEWLLRRVNVSFPGGELVKIAISGEDAAEATLLVNAVVEAFRTEVVDHERKSKLARIAELEMLRLEKEGDVDGKRKTLLDLSKKLGTSQNETAAAIHRAKLEYFSNTQSELLRWESSAKQAEANAQAAKSALESRQFEVTPAMVEEQFDKSPRVQTLKAQIAQLEAKKTQTEQIAKSKEDREVVRIQKQIETLQISLENVRTELRPQIESYLHQTAETRVAELVQRFDREARMHREHVQLLSDRLKELQKELESTGQEATDLEFHRKEMENAEKVLNRTNEELGELRVEVDAPARANVLMAATEPKSRDTDKRDKAVPMAAAAAAGLAVLLVGFLEWRARRITSPVDVIREVGMRVVGTVPALLSVDRVGPAGNGELSPRVQRWYRVFEESFDVLRATLLYGRDGPPPRSLMVTSSHGREGKTTLSAHIAASLARAGRSTLIVDTDFRRPSLHTLFGLSRVPGFADVVEGRIELAQVIQPTVIPKLFVIGAGNPSGHISEFISNPRIADLLKSLPEQWDNVVIDAPPILPVSDGLILGQHVDGVVLTALSGVTGAVPLQDCQERLQAVGIRILGLVLMGFEPSSYYGYYVSGYYRRYAERYAAEAIPGNGAGGQ